MSYRESNTLLNCFGNLTYQTIPWPAEFGEICCLQVWSSVSFSSSSDHFYLFSLLAFVFLIQVLLSTICVIVTITIHTCSWLTVFYSTAKLSNQVTITRKTLLTSTVFLKFLCKFCGSINLNLVLYFN